MELKNPLDMHLHLRDGDILALTAPLSARDFRAAVIMPNLVPPITSQSALNSYKKRVQDAANADKFTPLMTLFFQNYDYEFLVQIRSEIFAIKLYPAGITTNSASGVSDLNVDALRPTLEAMSALEIPLLVHGETSGFVLDREKNFAQIYAKIAREFPKLRIVMEHITTKALCELLLDYENLYATITLHHLILTLDDVIGYLMRPHLFCKPIAKTYEDRKALQELAFGASSKVMFGSDSAPHPQSAKECCGCAAGIFTAPIALALLVQIFEENSNFENLQKFISNNATTAHKLEFKDEKIVRLAKREWQVPLKYGDIVPFMAGEILRWKVV